MGVWPHTDTGKDRHSHARTPTSLVAKSERRGGAHYDLLLVLHYRLGDESSQTSLGSSDSDLVTVKENLDDPAT